MTPARLMRALGSTYGKVCMSLGKDNPSRVGQNYFYGISKRKNYRKAFPHLLDAAFLGYDHCQNLVGYCYHLGLGVEKDSALAAYWYQQAAKAMHKEALYNLATMYEKGDGVELNLRKAFSLYRKAAELGEDWAQCNLGVMYLDGIGTKQNLAKGLEWMRKAAKRGDAIAQYNLGMAYLEGEGVQKNKQRARTWLEKAAQQGQRRASSALRRAI